MSNEKDEIILMDSDKAASLKTVTGWVSRNGNFCGDNETLARWVGATHIKCEQCGAVHKDGFCQKCFDASRRAVYDAMPVVEWDTDCPVVIFGTNEYFWDFGDIETYAEDNDIPLSEMDLVLCVPRKPPPIDALELFSDYVPDDPDEHSIDQAVLDAVDALNKAIEAAPPFSWTQGNQRVVITDNDQQD
jgi:hypothetical protein